ncbi:MAG: PH domain-containing protein [Paludibacter sp.]
MGNYVNNNLFRNEQVVFETKYHWIHYFSLESLFTLGIWPTIQYYTDEFVVTNKRIIIKKGLLSYFTLEMNLDRIETVNVRQSIFGRIVGYGALTIIGTGGTRESFHCIRNPLQFRRSFMESI